MEPTELEEALEDLEMRLERLRALYEQYFLGIEKVPPAVARNDVDRRIWALRKVQIRNTAKRFKLQTIVQRYNTFQQYWARICREIEDGTYSPHVARARKQLDPDRALTIATRRRLGMYRRSSGPPAEDARDKALQEAESELRAALTYPEHTPVPLPDAWQDPRQKLSVPALGGSNAARDKASAPPARSSITDTWRDPRDRPSTVATRSSEPRALGAPPPFTSRPVSGAPSDRVGRPSGPLPPTRSLPARTTPSRNPGTSLEPVTLQFAPEPPVQAARSDEREPRPPRASLDRPARAGAPALRSDRSVPPRINAPLQRRTAPAEVGPRPPTPPPAAATPARFPSTARTTEPRTLPRAAPEHPPTGRGTQLTATGVEQLHRQLVEARRRNNDEGNIELNELRSRLEKTERQLRIQHGNRPIEFAVVVKNGRAMIKPTVR